MSVDQASFAALMTAQIQSVNEVISTVGALAVAPPTILATIFAAVQSARVPFDEVIAALDGDIDTTTVGGVVTGNAAPVLAASLVTQASDVSQQSLAIIAEAFLIRVGVNCANYPG